MYPRFLNNYAGFCIFCKTACTTVNTLLLFIDLQIIMEFSCLDGVLACALALDLPSVKFLYYWILCKMLYCQKSRFYISYNFLISKLIPESMIQANSAILFEELLYLGSGSYTAVYM